jgi:hypothetical protein
MAQMSFLGPYETAQENVIPDWHIDGSDIREGAKERALFPAV